MALFSAFISLHLGEKKARKNVVEYVDALGLAQVLARSFKRAAVFSPSSPFQQQQQRPQLDVEPHSSIFLFFV